MKKLLLSVFIVLLGTSAYAQPPICTASLDPITTGVLAEDVVYLDPGGGIFEDMTQDEYYEDTLSFVFVEEASAGPLTAEIDIVEITSLDNLPDGLEVAAVSGRADDNNAQGIVNPNALIFRDPAGSDDNGPYGCAILYGTPTGVTEGDLNDGTDSLEIVLNISVTPRNVPIPVEDQASLTMRFFGAISGRFSEQNQTLNLKVAPNPATADLNLFFTTMSTQDMTFEVYDIQGRKTNLTSTGTFHPGDHNVTLDVSSLSNGMYFVKSVVGETVHTQKFMKR